MEFATFIGCDFCALVLNNSFHDVLFVFELMAAYVVVVVISGPVHLLVIPSSSKC